MLMFATAGPVSQPGINSKHPDTMIFCAFFLLLHLIQMGRSASVFRFSFAQTGSDFGPMPVALLNQKSWFTNRESGGGGSKTVKTSARIGIGDISNNVDSGNNNNLSNNLNSVSQADNMVISNSNNVNQITVSILPVPGWILNVNNPGTRVGPGGHDQHWL